MARPESFRDLRESDRSLTLGTVEMANISGYPKLIRAVADLIESALTIGGKVDGTTYLTLSRPKTDTELVATLKGAQQTWDVLDKRYHAIKHAEETDEASLFPEYRDYEGYALRQHAENEGYPQLRTTAKEKVDATT